MLRSKAVSGRVVRYDAPKQAATATTHGRLEYTRGCEIEMIRRTDMAEFAVLIDGAAAENRKASLR